MKFNDEIPTFGDKSFRGDCSLEGSAQKSFVSYVRAKHSKTYGAIIVHNRNEGKRSFQQAARFKADGMTKGASDILIPAGVSFVCEMKRADHTKSQWKGGQQEYLLAAKDCGAFSCLALGLDGAIEAFEYWLENYCTKP